MAGISIHKGKRVCYCGAALTDIIAKDGGTRLCIRNHEVVPCMNGSTCGGRVYVPGMGEPLCKIRERGKVVAPFYTCDQCAVADSSRDHDTASRTAIDVMFQQDQKCELCGLRGQEHGDMLHPHRTSQKRIP